ncbi:MAG: cbb3-type cytochrome c oxidase subunit I [Sulfuricella sp.]
METVLRDRQDVRRLAAGWLLLALTALALSTAYAVLVVAARTPLLGRFFTSGDLFRSALVLHVGLAVVVWFLACAAGLWTLAAAGAASRWRWTALALAYAGVLAMMVPLFFGATAPVLANYIPVLDTPVFLLGLAWFLGGVALCGATSIGDLVSRLRAAQTEAWRVGAALSIGAMTIALGSFVASLAMAGKPAGFEVLAWGPGHVLQFVHVLLLMSVWTVLGERALGKAVAPRRWLAGLLLLAAVPVLAAPAIYVAYPVDSADFRHAFTTLMAWGSWPAAALLAGRLLLQLARAGRTVWRAPRTLPLLSSILLFVLGCAFGALIRDDSTMVPAHYHGTVGAVTLAYMALGYQLLPAFGFGNIAGRLVRWQPTLYGIGLMILAGALAWSGWLGVPRKTLDVDVIIQYPAYFAAMGLAGLGGLLAVAGAALYVVNIVRILRAERPAVFRADPSQPWRWTLTSTVALTLASGLFFTDWPERFGVTGVGQAAATQDTASHVAQKSREEIDRRFAEGVAQLNAKQYNDAADSFHRVLELAPEMPEAHVNMGYAMIGLKRYDVARDFFEAATNIRPAQINAYYGLAEALDGLNDLEGALGAMRSYIHRSRPDDPYLSKARAALWEWETALGRKPGKDSPKNGK